MKINPTVHDNIDQYKKLWTSEKIVTIDNFLTEEDANKYRDYLLSLDDEQWCVSIHPYQPDIYTFYQTPDNKEFIQNGIRSANEANNRGEFSYCFKRTEQYRDDGYPFDKILMSEESLKIINDITEMDITTSISVFASCYDRDSFLSTHTDCGRGKIAFVYNLTRDWDPSQGGCFQLLEDNWSGIRKQVTPKFNSLTIFCVTGDGVPHRVTKVSSECPDKRIAFSGWLV